MSSRPALRNCAAACTGPAFSEAVFVGPRTGDIPLSFAAVEKANAVLGWKAEYDYKDCARDSWNWQVQNPHGYAEDQ